MIQDKRVRRIGGTREIPINTRIIAATHRPLEQLVESKLFRQDLYYRINVLPIHIPPLCGRVEDIPRLAEHFLFQLASKLNKPLKRLAPEAMEKLAGHLWPGNVRELKNVIERAAILCEGDMIDADHILFSHELRRSWQSTAAMEDARSFNLKKVLADYERDLIHQVMRRCRSKREAARTLEISHTALMNKLKKYES